MTTNAKLQLPLRFDSRSAMRVEVNFEFPATGTADAQILSDFSAMKLDDTLYAVQKHRCEFIIEDAAGNEFDLGSKLISREILNLWWTLPNHNGLSRAIHYGRIGRAWISWKAEKLKALLGFYQ